MAWLFLAAFSFLFAWVLARLSVEHPDCHGIPLFARCAFGRGCERGVALLLGLAVAGGIIPVYCIAAARRLVNLGLVPEAWPLPALGFGVILGATGMSLLGLRLGLRLQMMVMGIVVAVLVLAIMLALPHARPVEVLAPPPGGWGSVGMAAAVCFFAIIGWENAAPMAEEVSDPERNVPRAAMLAVALVSVLYVRFAAVLAAVVSPQGGPGFSPVAALLSTALGSAGDRVGNIVALVLILVAANAWVLATSRMLFGLARNGMLPAWFHWLSPRPGAPSRVNLLIVTVGATVLTSAGWFGLSEPKIMAATSVTFLVIYGVVMAGAAVLLRQKAERAAAGLALLVLAAMAAFYASAMLLIAGSLTLLTIVLGKRRWRSAGAARPRA